MKTDIGPKLIDVFRRFYCMNFFNLKTCNYIQISKFRLNKHFIGDNSVNFLEVNHSKIILMLNDIIFRYIYSTFYKHT